jgi:hypothetical protein
MKGDKKKERYGVINDCDRTRISASTTESGDNEYHLEVIQEANVGVAESNFPLGTCLCDFSQLSMRWEQPIVSKDLTCEGPVE